MPTSVPTINDHTKLTQRMDALAAELAAAKTAIAALQAKVAAIQTPAPTPGTAASVEIGGVSFAAPAKTPGT
jgi:hypothetical protein